jgi:hypothetical protein
MKDGQIIREIYGNKTEEIQAKLGEGNTKEKYDEMVNVL